MNKPLIFAIEDDAATRRLLEKAITNIGFAFEGFDRIRDAKARLERAAPDVIVVDGLLPDGSGIDFIRELVASSAGRRPKLVFFSAIFRDLRTRHYLKDLGVEVVMDKPMSILQLREKIAGLLNIQLIGPRRAEAPAA
ncbi:MAG: response regulator [Chrysiogenetes bacterium]|nr:response regulator [Chrysiogenetes bacterium]